MQSFPLWLKNLFSTESLFASKQMSITEFFSNVGQFVWLKIIVNCCKLLDYSFPRVIYWKYKVFLYLKLSLSWNNISVPCEFEIDRAHCRTTDLLRKFKQVLLRPSLIIIYKAFIKLHLDYWSQVTAIQEMVSKIENKKW